MAQSIIFIIFFKEKSGIFFPHCWINALGLKDGLKKKNWSNIVQKNTLIILLEAKEHIWTGGANNCWHGIKSKHLLSCDAPNQFMSHNPFIFMQFPNGQSEIKHVFFNLIKWLINNEKNQWLQSPYIHTYMYVCVCVHVCVHASTRARKEAERLINKLLSNDQLLFIIN